MSPEIEEGKSERRIGEVSAIDLILGLPIFLTPRPYFFNLPYFFNPQNLFC